jgi:hypothetical protein
MTFRSDSHVTHSNQQHTVRVMIYAMRGVYCLIERDLWGASEWQVYEYAAMRV